jgi:peptidoglycan/xylan/chitin deacetylase (PgdA/CDA1 family)
MRDLQATPADRLRLRARAVALAALRLRPRPAGHGLRIVHYHYVFDDQRPQFARQIALLASALEPVSMSEAVRRLRGGAVTGHELAITFDDGFENQLTNAAPVLDEHGVTACFYLISELVEAPEARVDEICRDRILMPLALEPLTWAQAGELARRGHELGSHTRTHPNLAALGDAARREELAGSKADLEARLGVQVAHFSAPFGGAEQFTPAVARSAEEVGYASAATAQRGDNDGPGSVFSLRRHHLVADWSLRDVRYFLGL